MNKIENFNLLVDRAMSAKNLAHMRPVVTKELLHYDILFALEKDRLLEKLTFQGGTCLRLCYGSQRYSEDLDFVGGKNFSSSDMLSIKKCIEKYIGERYGLEIVVKEPKELAQELRDADIKINKWQISITTSPERKDIPKQKIKLEIANVPAYSRVPQALRQNYEFLPDGYEDTLIMTETLDEIMADKLISFINSQKIIRHRDIWDLHWLKQQDSKINPDYILLKIKDYAINNYFEKLQEKMSHLDEIIRGKDFKNEILRFIPVDAQERTLQKEKFVDYLVNETKTLLSNVAKIVSANKEDLK